MILSDFALINPTVKLIKGQEYDFVPMENVTSGQRKVIINKKIYTGGGVKFQNHDTLFARITPCLQNGKIGQFLSNDDKGGFGSTEFIVFRGKKDVSLSDYVYYLCQTENVKNSAIKSMSGATGRQRVNNGIFSQIEVFLMGILSQQKIASILSAYDDLIENNNKRIKILEETAQTIYKNFVKSKNNNWVDIKIGEVISVTGGGTPSTKNDLFWKNGDVNWYSPTDLTASNSHFIFESSRKITQIGLKSSSATLFPSYSVMMTSRATVGVVAINTTPACTNQGFIVCIPNEKLSSSYIYHWIIDNVSLIKSLAKGATFMEISRSTFKNIKISVPPKQDLDIFNKTLEPINNLIVNLLQKNKTLLKTKNLLLPKLISGELDVEGLDIKIRPEIL